MLPKATEFSPSLSSRAMRSKVGPWKRGEHEAMTKWSRPRSSTAFSIIARPSVPHMNWLTFDLDDAVEGARVLGQRLEVDDAADVAAALAEEDPGPHRAPPVAAGWRAPMRSRNGSTSWECVWTPTTFSGSAPSASARSCCTCRCTKGNSSPVLAEMMSL